MTRTRKVPRRAAAVRAAAAQVKAAEREEEEVEAEAEEEEDEAEQQQQQEEREETEEQEEEGSWLQLRVHAGTLPMKSSARWEASLAALRAYVGENEGRYPSRDRSGCSGTEWAEGQKLANWRYNQQHKMRKGGLSAARVRKLEQLRGWSWGAAGPSKPNQTIAAWSPRRPLLTPSAKCLVALSRR